MRLSHFTFAVITSFASASLAQTLDFQRNNPVRLSGSPGAATQASMKRFKACIGYVAEKPLFDLALPSTTKTIEVEPDVPTLAVFVGAQPMCLNANRANTLTVPSNSPARLQLFPLGVDGDGAGPSNAYQPGQKVTVRIEDVNAPAAFGPSTATLSIDAPLRIEKHMSVAAPESANPQGDSFEPNCGAFLSTPSAVLDLKIALDGPQFDIGFRSANTSYGVLMVGPLDGPRAEQKRLCITGVKAGFETLASGRYALFAPVGAPGHFAISMTDSSTQSAGLTRVSTDDSIDSPDIMLREVQRNFRGLPVDVFSFSTLESFHVVSELWRASSRALWVTPKMLLNAQSVPGLQYEIPPNEPLLVTSIVASDTVEVMTADAIFANIRVKHLEPFHGPALVPTNLRWVPHFDPTDDALFKFVTPGLTAAHERFKKLDEQAGTCWQRHYNPRGEGLDVVTYVNGHIVNVESLDDRFRAAAEKACRKPLTQAEQARTGLLKQLATERGLLYAKLLRDASSAIAGQQER